MISLMSISSLWLMEVFIHSSMTRQGMVQPKQEVPLFGQQQMLTNTAVLMNPPMERLDRTQGELGDDPRMQIYLP